jgi:aspartyl-tRNA(Asn)/glutamyl-tRNA(Gln) amidotransferase subunit A
VARLRAAGAIVIGQTFMTELGMTVLGTNVNRSMPRNPHDPTRLAGGSSTGAAVCVSVGVAPVALGLDGGGSIRNPAALNGVFGLKPTFGRIPVTGNAAAQSVGHIGPLGISTYDLAVFVEATAGFDPADAASGVGPALHRGDLVQALGRGVSGLSIGVDEKMWHGLASDIEKPLRQALDALVREGATIVELELPITRHATPVGFFTIGLEFLATYGAACFRHFDQLTPDLQLMVNVLSAFKPDDYLDAQRIRGVIRREVATALSQVDVLALPTLAATAPKGAKTDYFFDSEALEAISRYAYLGNLTGLPAASAPVGVAADGLPVGLQIIADAWDEATVLQVLAHLERIGVAVPKRPMACLDVLA